MALNSSAASDRCRQREGDHRHVESDVAQARHAASSREPARPAPAPPATPAATPTSAAGEREHERFGEQLRSQPRPRGAEGGAHRHLLPSPERSRQQQVADVGARDQQHEADGAEQQQQRPLGVADQRVAQRLGVVLRAAILLGILSARTRVDSVSSSDTAAAIVWPGRSRPSANVHPPLRCAGAVGGTVSGTITSVGEFGGK